VIISASRSVEVLIMSALLTYHWRNGLLSAVAAGKTFHLSTYQNSSAIDVWQKVQGSRPGRVTLWAHCFALPHQHFRGGPSIPDSVAAGQVLHRIEVGGTEKLEIYDYPGEYAQRFDGVGPRGGRLPHPHVGAAVYVGGKSGGTYIHGWPPCHHKMCIAVRKQWDQLFAAIATEKELSFSIAQ
jgi:hypothetical protein